MQAPDAFDPPVLEAQTVHLWWFLCGESEEFSASGPGPLDARERERATRFRTPSLRRRFEHRRTVLRELLGAYLGVPAAGLRLTEGEHKKPLLGGEHATDLRFNLSHTGAWVLVGVARGREVGVDVETLERRGDFEGVARRVFTVGEREVLERCGASAEDEWKRAFLRGWSRKEAFLKAYGTGLLREPRDLHVGLEERPQQDAGGPWFPEDGTLGSWGQLFDLDAPPRHRAAVAAEGAGWEVRVLRTWPEAEALGCAR